MNAMVMNAKGVPIIETWAGMRQRHFNERVEVLKYLAAGRLTYRQAAKVLDVKAVSISRFVHMNGLDIKFKQLPRSLSKERRDEMAKVLEERKGLSQMEPWLTCREASEKLGVPRDTLKTYSYRHGIKWKPVGSQS